MFIPERGSSFQKEKKQIKTPSTFDIKTAVNVKSLADRGITISKFFLMKRQKGEYFLSLDKG
jgi:tRNA 2-selenouridine synthase SelU